MPKLLNNDVGELRAKVEQLQDELDAAVELLLQYKRITWGWSQKHNRMGHFLDGQYCGERFIDVVKHAVEIAAEKRK